MEWYPQLQPLFKKYGRRKHPLEYKNVYQLIVMVVLSAQATDVMINKLASELFEKFPSFKHLAKAKPEDLYPFIKSVRGSRKKADWLVRIAQTVGDDNHIPLTLDGLVQLPGIGRKSANVILREAGAPAEGIFVDLHVLRVVPRIGMAKEEKPEKIEKALMELIPRDHWHAAGMSFSYLGREICRPTDPECTKCPVSGVCEYYKNR